MVSPFDAVTQSQLRRIKPRGRWNGHAHGWEFPLAAADALQQALGLRFPVTSALQEWLDWCQHPLPRCHLTALWWPRLILMKP